MIQLVEEKVEDTGRPQKSSLGKKSLLAEAEDGRKKWTKSLQAKELCTKTKNRIWP